VDRHDIVQPLLTDYVLDELDVSRRRDVEQHLRTCAECASEARELAQTFQSIGLAPEPIAPPPHLRAQVLARLARESDAVTSSPPAPAPREARRYFWPLAFAVAVGALLFAIATILTSLQVRRDLQRELVSARVEADRLVAEMSATRVQADLAVAILTAGDMRRIDLAGYEASRDAVARAYWSPTQGLLIVADRLPAPPAGRVYQVWLIEPGAPRPVSAGLIDAASGGRGMLLVPPPAGVSSSPVVVAVTDEPRGGVPAPTGSKHLAGST
jgi:anti-sigma-K factor RskA